VLFSKGRLVNVFKEREIEEERGKDDV